MRRRWEYATMWHYRDPGTDDMPVTSWVRMPNQEFRLVATDERLDMGADGWELVGAPHVESAVFTYKAGNDTWHDRSYWVEMYWYYKREVET
jgi:hypothetical protein